MPRTTIPKEDHVSRILYPGHDRLEPPPELAASTVDPQERALTDARNELQAQANRIKQLEAVVRSAAHVLQPFVHSTRR